MTTETNTPDALDIAKENVTKYERTRILWELLTDLLELKPGCSMMDVVTRMREIQQKGEEGITLFSAIIKAEGERRTDEKAPENQ